MIKKLFKICSGLIRPRPYTIRGVNLPKPDGTTLATGFDWIQYTAYGSPEKLMLQGSFLFTTTKKDYGTKYFNELYLIETCYNGVFEPCAEIEIKPRVNFINSHIVQVKLLNKFCYQGEPKHFIELMNNELGLVFKRFTRLDTFIDFQYIDCCGGDTQVFLQNCIERKIIIKGKSYKVHNSRNAIDGITWGSSKSGLSITMYNKSKEMRKKGLKPWINELHELAGFVPEQDTYRLEFRHSKETKAFIEMSTGEYIGCHTSLDIMCQLPKYISMLYHNHFLMAIYEPSVRFSRLLRVFPINIERTTVMAIRISEKIKSSNYDKYVVKSMMKLMEHHQLFTGDRIAVASAALVVEHIANTTGLAGWVNKKYSWHEIHNSKMTFHDYANSQCAKEFNLKQTEINFN